MLIDLKRIIATFFWTVEVKTVLLRSRRCRQFCQVITRVRRYFLCYGVGHVSCIQRIVDLFEFIRDFEEVLPFVNEQMLRCVQQDSDPKHISKRAALWFQTHNISFMKQSGHSPVENVWGDIRCAFPEVKPRNTEQQQDAHR